MIKIGITGHRNLDKKYFTDYESKVFTQLLYLQNKYVKAIVLSQLADGADRLIVHQALKLDIEYIAVLPMSQKEYEKDFTCKSKDEFYYLLSKAKEIITLEDKNTTRDVSYEKAGHFVSDNSDILFALWDGKYNNLQGGTGEIVKYHMSKKSYVLYHLLVSRNGDLTNNMIKFKKYKRE